ncbi:MAG: hypothetical protein ATN35_08205 [Epulopiscium sp. Nele67-Bin004]|nr:MAG: hypothetical protein ATN35_08205 [Epulopiscium sp. Nele67-Bin004]
MHDISKQTNPRHSEIIGNIYVQFRNYLKGKRCKVFTDNIDVYLDGGRHNFVVPDLSILCEPDKFSQSGYHGVPSLIVEVISPSSTKVDRGMKFNLYESYGVPEYWLIDPLSGCVEQYVLQDGNYMLLNVEYDEADRAGSIVPTIFDNLEIDIVDIFE